MQENQRGGIIFVFLLALVFMGMLGLAMVVVGEDAYQVHLLRKQREIDCQSANLITVAEIEAVSRLHSQGGLGADAAHADQRKAHIRELVTWMQPSATRVDALFVAPSWPDASPFSKSNTLSADHDPLGIHPLGLLYSCSAESETTISLDDGGYLGPRSQTVNLVVREIPSSELEYIAGEKVTPSQSTVSVTVNGTALLADGFEDDGAPTRLSATNLIAPFGNTANGGVSGSRILIDPVLRPTWGVAPLEIASNRPAVSDLGKRQSYFSGATRVITLMGGKLSNAPAAGVALSRLVDAVDRVTVKLADLAGTETAIYINCISTNDIAAGVVIVGSPFAGTPRVIATNGSLWLSGNNTAEAILATSSGKIKLTDGSGGSLSQSWAGYILSPAATVWETPQSGAGHQLTVQGTVFTHGANTGNLSTLVINKLSGSALSGLSDRFQIILPGR